MPIIKLDLPDVPPDLPVPEKRGLWLVYACNALTQYEVRLFFWLEFGREPDRLIYDPFEGRGFWWVGWVANEELILRSLPRGNTANMHCVRDLPPRGARLRVTYATVEHTDGHTSTIAVWHNVTLVNPLEGEPYIDFAGGQVVSREQYDGDLFSFDFLEAAKRWSILEYAAFDWPQSVLERNLIRPQTFIL